MNELAVWRKLLLFAGLLALTSLTDLPAQAAGEVRVTFSAGGPYWCWLRSAAGPVTAGPVQTAGNEILLSAPLGPRDTVTALEMQTGRTATQALKFTPDGFPVPVHFSAADFRRPDAPLLVSGLAGLSAVLAGLLGWQTLRGRRSAPPFAPLPRRAEPEAEEETFPLAARGPGMILPAATAAATLVGVQGLVAGGTFALTTGDVRVGRDGDNDIVLAENMVSRRHARLQRDAQGRILLTDLGSANGVYVNGTRIARAYLAAGDEIKIGDNFFRFHLAEHIEEKPQ